MPDWLKKLAGSVTGLFHFNQPVHQHPAAPKPQVNWNTINQKLDTAQHMLNPYIASANTNTELIDRYKQGQFNYQKPTYEPPPGFPTNEPATVQGPPQQQGVNNAQYLPYLQQLMDQTKLGTGMSAPPPVDNSSYLQQAANIRSQRQANEQSLLGQTYG